MEIIRPFTSYPINPFMEERWTEITSVSVPNIKEGYYISNIGRVWSSLTNSFRVPVCMPSGYYVVTFRTTNGSYYQQYIHRIIMIEFHFIDNYKEMQVNHENGKKYNNFDMNLSWCTPKENSQHAIDTGLNPMKGENAHFAKITNYQAEQIAQLIVEGYKQKEIANIVGCSIETVECISQGLTWKDVYKKYNLQNYTRSYREGFSDNDVENICKYMQDHINEYENIWDLFRNLIRDLFGREMTRADRTSLYRYYNRKTRNEITCKYNY